MFKSITSRILEEDHVKIMRTTRYLYEKVNDSGRNEGGMQRL